MHVNLHEGLLKYMYITVKLGYSKLITNSHYDKVVYILPNLKHFVGCKKLSNPVITNQNLLSLELCCKHVSLCYYCLTRISTGAYGFERETPPPNKVIVTTSRSHSDRMVTEAVEACNPDEVVRVGGAGHKVGAEQGG